MSMLLHQKYTPKPPVTVCAFLKLLAREERHVRHLEAHEDAVREREQNPPPARATKRSSRLRTNESEFGNTLRPPPPIPRNGQIAQLGER